MQRPASDVHAATGLVGLTALCCVLGLAVGTGLPAGTAALLLLLGTAIPMVVWSVAVERVHRNPDAGLDPALRRPVAEVSGLAAVKCVGLAATFALIGLGYFCLLPYGEGLFDPYFALLELALPPVLLSAPLYLAWTSQRMVAPRDGLWHFGALICLRGAAVDPARIADHLRGWAIKAFFLALMVGSLFALTESLLAMDRTGIATDPARLAVFVLTLMFLIDVCFAATGYVLTLRVLGSQIRSANPHLSAWVAALVCYPPFAVMREGGPLNYRSLTQDWTVHFAGMDVLLALWAVPLLALTGLYVWATVIFGIRFSNLTHRGIVTNGPYRYFRHPAYLAKSLFWWLMYLPFVPVTDPADAVRATILLLGVNAIYLARARTEERHLMTDPKYRAYAAWIAEHGLLPRALRRLRALAGRPGSGPGGAPLGQREDP